MHFGRTNFYNVCIVMNQNSIHGILNIVYHQLVLFVIWIYLFIHSLDQSFRGNNIFWDHRAMSFAKINAGVAKYVGSNRYIKFGGRQWDISSSEPGMNLLLVNTCLVYTFLLWRSSFPYQQRQLNISKIHCVTKTHRWKHSAAPANNSYISMLILTFYH